MRLLLAATAAAALAACATAPAAQAPSPGRPALLVVANKQEATASIIDVASGRTVATVPTGTGPHEAAVSHDGRWAVVTDYGAQSPPGSSLTVIDLDALAVARKVDLGTYRRPHGVVFLPGDTLLAVTAEANQAVLLVDFRSGAVTAVPTGAQGTHMVAATADGSTLFTANVGSGSVTRIDVRTREARSAPVAPVSEGVAVLPDGSQVWVGSNQQHTVTVLDGRTLAPIDTLPAPGLPYRLNVSADGRRMVVTNPVAGAVRVFDTATRRELAAITIPLDPARATPQAQGNSQPVGSTVSADGRRAYVALQGMNAVAEVDLESFTVLRYFDTGAGPDGIALRP